MLGYLTIAISSILAIIAVSLNTEKSEKGEIKTVFKKPNMVGFIVIGLILVLSVSQILIQNKQEDDQEKALENAEKQRKMDLKNMAELLKRAKENSAALTIQIEQLDSQKYQMSKQLRLSGKLIETQELAINKTSEYNESLKLELEKQKYSLLPLRLLFTIEIDGKKIIKEEGYKNIIDSILYTYNSGIKSNSYNITENYDSSYIISINNADYIPEPLRFSNLEMGFYKSVNRDNIKSIVFQWDSSLLRLRFDDLNILSYRTNSFNYESSILYETVRSGIVMNENHKIHSSLELNNLFLNVKFSYHDYKIKKIMLVTGRQNEEIYKNIQIEEIFKDLYNPDNGKWYIIKTDEKKSSDIL